jgi:hypothetical protein
MVENSIAAMRLFPLANNIYSTKLSPLMRLFRWIAPKAGQNNLPQYFLDAYTSLP